MRIKRKERNHGYIWAASCVTPGCKQMGRVVDDEMIDILFNQLVTADGHVQLDLFARDKTVEEDLEKMIDGIRSRFGPYSVLRCAMLQDRHLTGFNPKDDHVIHPISFFR